MQIIKLFLAKRLTTSSVMLDNSFHANEIVLGITPKGQRKHKMNATQTSRNVAMYGFEDIDSYIESVKESITYQFTGANMVIAGLMSDAQHLMSFNDTERARQTLNIAKTLTFMVMDGELVGTQPSRV
jgi:hypothetical protein